MSRVSKAVAAQSLDQTCKQNGWKLLTPYVASKEKVKVRCAQGHEFQVTPNNAVHKASQCPICRHYTYSVYDAGMFYAVRWIHPATKHSFIKFGITNNVDYLKRIAQQAKLTDYEPEQTITVRYFIDGNAPKALERVMHDNLVTGVVTKNEFADGCTETVEDNQFNISFIKEMVW